MSWIDWIEQHLLPCPSKYFLGVDCPGCGMQRSMMELLRGNFIESLKVYPGLIPVLFTVIFLGFHLKYKFNNGAKTLQYSFIFSAIVIVISFVVKQVQLFSS